MSELNPTGNPVDQFANALDTRVSAPDRDVCVPSLAVNNDRLTGQQRLDESKP
ncbi:MAG TPA: hypothetical protein VN688_05690 [Gemmataceae bacterium]|nr:hypothetical protein [Gemmataceae bacterium]